MTDTDRDRDTDTDILNTSLETINIQNEYNTYQSIKNGYKIPNIVHQTFCSTKLPFEIRMQQLTTRIDSCLAR